MDWIRFVAAAVKIRHVRFFDDKGSGTFFRRIVGSKRSVEVKIWTSEYLRICRHMFSHPLYMFITFKNTEILFYVILLVLEIRIVRGLCSPTPIKG